MYGVPTQGHLQGQTREDSNTRFFTQKKEHVDMCSYIIYVVYICRTISCLKGFALSYHIPHTYVAGYLLKVKNAKNEACV